MRSKSVDLWSVRTDEFICSLVPVLAWAREARHYAPIEPDLHAAASLRGLIAIVDQGRLPLAGPEESFVDLSTMPNGLAGPLRGYIEGIADYDPAASCECRCSGEPGKQHGYVLLTARTTLARRLS